MKSLAIAPIAAVAVLTAYVMTSDAQADLSQNDAPALSCEVRGITPGLAREGRPSRLQIAWNPVEEAELVRTDDWLSVKLEGAGGVLRGERAYVLTSVELHGRANSRRYPGEARFIHENAIGDKVVIGLYLTEGATNPAMETLKAAVDADDPHVLAGLDPRELLPETDGARLVYADRTPPACAPRVIWTVVDAPVELSRDQLAALLPAMPTIRAGAAE